LIRTQRADVLAGTRFLSARFAALEVLRAAGVPFESGEEALRKARLRAVFQTEIQLEHFSLELLRSRPGWDEAFAGTISDLEGAGLRPDDLKTQSLERLRDVAAIWRAIVNSAGHSWTIQRTYSEAAAVLGQSPGAWPLQGAVLAFAGGDITIAEADFLKSIPDVSLGLLASRPARQHYLRRMEALLGRDAGTALRSAVSPRAADNERELLASFLFEAPTVLGAPTRPRSEGPDGTVDLEEHSGIEAEVEATADWVVRQVAAGTALEDIAVLIPALDPIAGLVTERLARLPWQEGSLPVHVAGGLPFTSSATGARALAVVRALRSHLAAASIVEVLPVLRLSVSDGRHLSHGAASELVWSLGIVGGNPARPEGALEWSISAADREAELSEELVQIRAADFNVDGSRSARRVQDVERLLSDLRAARPALEALVEVARYVLQGARLDALWPALRCLLQNWCLQPGAGARAESLLDERLSVMASEPTCGSLTRDDALRTIEETITSARVPLGRFGDPAVYVGSVRGAVGLRFHAVRVIGLAEGHLPSVSREDPVVPDALRQNLYGAGTVVCGVAPPTAVDRALEDLHALDTIIRNTEERIALSAPRLDVERSQREPSSVILEAAAALGRPNRVTGERAATIPDGTALRRDAFAPARMLAAIFRRNRPLSEAAWQDGVSQRVLRVPLRWRSAASLCLERASVGASLDDLGPMDGILGSPGIDLPVPGLTADRPISPSSLARLLNCPYAFLLEDLLGFEEPAVPPPRREIGQPAYGELFHAVAAEFYSANGASFCAHEGTLAHWLARADEATEKAFRRFLKQYPLVGEAVRSQQHERLRRDVHDLIEYDWGTRGRCFVAVEREFGRPKPIQLPLGDRTLFLRGRIDRLDIEEGKALVRDLKTASPQLRLGKKRAPDPALDLQIAIYGLVAKTLATEWQIPAHVSAAYAYFGRRGSAERAFREDFDEILVPEAQRWLGVAAALLEELMFPRTPSVSDCGYCCFRPVCGEGAQERAARLFAQMEGALSELAALKGVAPEEET
jgi:RecB family exonuclease